ncbi:hypothetical protein Ahy_B09g097651 [Arachis hypogaea]|uniref:hAT-like transposase RNase-H fold domain-containing protein n=1 Tax=Arachis hypogaea TaxID=3818 RepID=A0A444XQ05_ARAHY|nr:hypothetical protein Ahy_B09g097651 [Arachis hypogaea]
MRSHLKICISNPGSDRGKRQKTGTSPSLEAQSILPFLEMFYDATLCISGFSYVTSNLYMKEVFALGRRIQQYRDDDDLSISLMASKMKAKYNKYWGNAKTINMLLIAVVLDPCHKLDYVEWCLVNSFGAEVDSELKTKLSSCLHSLYNFYQGLDEGNQDDTLSQPSESDKAKDIYDMGLYRRSTGRKSNLKSELDCYLNEDYLILSEEITCSVGPGGKDIRLAFPYMIRLAYVYVYIGLFEAQLIAVAMSFLDRNIGVNNYSSWNVIF